MFTRSSVADLRRAVGFDEPFNQPLTLTAWLARLTRRMAAHTAQAGGHSHHRQPLLPGAADTVRRLDRRGDGCDAPSSSCAAFATARGHRRSAVVLPDGSPSPLFPLSVGRSRCCAGAYRAVGIIRGGAVGLLRWRWSGCFATTAGRQ
ncbi:hypothetical protein KCP70_02335 [Salmonella enterica subsp. enterica]|nr:hypothetical protein KCP70_02335 [Salmonella enterica subsp. enterica]